MYIYGDPDTVYSGTSDNGHSEEWTTSLQWTNCSPPAYNILSIHFYLRRKDNENGQNARPQRVHYSEVPLYNREKIFWGVGVGEFKI